MDGDPWVAQKTNDEVLDFFGSAAARGGASPGGGGVGPGAGLLRGPGLLLPLGAAAAWTLSRRH